MGHGAGHAAADLAAGLIGTIAAGEALIASPDQAGTGFITGTLTESEPPWNAGAAWAVLVPWQGLRRLENQVRAELGLRPVWRGGSGRNTRECARAVARMAPALPEYRAAEVESELRAWCQLGLALNAVHRPPQWYVIDMPDGTDPPDCPHCTRGSLRANPALGVVACIYPNCPPAVAGSRPWAEISNVGGKLTWRWEDGLVQP